MVRTTRMEHVPGHHDGDEGEAPARGYPGKATLTSRLPPSAASIARQVVAQLASPATDRPEVAVERYLAHGAGQPLDADSQAFAREGFGYDFGAVRVHTGVEAAASAEAIGASAYTVGNDVVFGAGQYRPGTPDGRWLLAHELAHVVQHGGDGGAAPARKALELGDGHDAAEVAADAAADRVMAGESGVAAGLARGPARIRRFRGELWPGQGAVARAIVPNQFELEGSVEGGGVHASISGEEIELHLRPDTAGVITMRLRGTYIGMAGGNVLTRSVARGELALTQTWPFRCATDGTVTVDTGALVPGNGRNHPQHSNPFGLGESEIGVSFTAGAGTSTDGRAYLMETITFTSGGSGVSVGVGPVGIDAGGGSTVTRSIGIRVYLQDPPRPVAAPPPPQASAHAQASATVPVPARVPVPPIHRVFFAREGQTEGDAGALVRWAASLPRDAQDALRTGRLTMTVIGFASTTGSELRNYEVYSRERAEWARATVAPALGLAVDRVQLGYRGSYTAPAEDQQPGGVADPFERRVELSFAETAPTTTATVTAEVGTSP